MLSILGLTVCVDKCTDQALDCTARVSFNLLVLALSWEVTDHWFALEKTKVNSYPGFSLRFCNMTR